MGKTLSESDLTRFQRDGFIFPVPAVGAIEAAALCRRLADHEAEHGPLPAKMRQKAHMLFTGFADLARAEAILDAVEAITGPDLRVRGTSRFLQEAGAPCPGLDPPSLHRHA